MSYRAILVVALLSTKLTEAQTSLKDITMDNELSRWSEEKKVESTFQLGHTLNIGESMTYAVFINDPETSW